MIHLFVIRSFLAKVLAMSVICFPCFSEPVFAVERQELFKGDNSFMMAVEGGQQNIVGIPWFQGTRRLQDSQFVVEGAAEFNGGISKSSFASISPSEIRSETSKNESSDEGFDGQLALLLGFIFAVLIPMYSSTVTRVRPNVWGATRMPNVSGQRLRRR